MPASLFPSGDQPHKLGAFAVRIVHTLGVDCFAIVGVQIERQKGQRIHSRLHVEKGVKRARNQRVGEKGFAQNGFEQKQRANGLIRPHVLHGAHAREISKGPLHTRYIDLAPGDGVIQHESRLQGGVPYRVGETVRLGAEKP